MALGSNVGDSRGHIEQAIKLLTEKINNVHRAPLYTSKAVGYTEQPDFLNTAVAGQTALESAELLAFVKDVEQRVGRVARFRWGPREIDIDIIFYGDAVLQTETLAIPHPRFQERDFVLQPLIELNPTLRDPKSGQTVQTLLDKLPVSSRSILTQVDSEP